MAISHQWGPVSPSYLLKTGCIENSIHESSEKLIKSALFAFAVALKECAGIEPALCLFQGD
jgi:hypothetical protein